MLEDLIHLVRNSLWRMPLVLLAAALATYLLCFPVRAISHRLHLLDRPGHRSSHDKPVPRTGGLAIILGALAGVFLVTIPTLAFMVATAIGAAVALASLIDDIKPIPALPRLFVHIGVAAATIWKIGLIPHDLGLPFVAMNWSNELGLVIGTLFVVGFVNFYNFIDGINGNAACQGVWGGMAISLLLLYGHSGNSIFAAAALAGACLGFLPHNFPDAKMFMGDVGSTTLGFGLAMLTLIGGARGQLPWIAMILPLSYTIWDAGFTVLKRIVQGHNPLRPHREFHFHLLVRCGWSHDQIARVHAVIMGVCSLGALIYAWTPWHVAQVRLGVLIAIATMLASYTTWVHLYFARHHAEVGPAREGPAADSSGLAADSREAI